MNILLYLINRAKFDDALNKFAAACFLTATMYGYSAGVTASIVSTGTVQAARTKREETEYGMEDNSMEEPPAPYKIKTREDFVQRYRVGRRGRVREHIDQAGWDRYQDQCMARPLPPLAY